MQILELSGVPLEVVKIGVALSREDGVTDPVSQAALVMDLLCEEV